MFSQKALQTSMGFIFSVPLDVPCTYLIPQREDVYDKRDWANTTFYN